MVLWTGLDAESLMAQDDLVVCQIPSPKTNAELNALVLKYPIHNCQPYCSSAGNCRFGFPKDPETSNHFRSENGRSRAYYKRDVRDARVNNYNPYLLQLTSAAMDIQINYSDGVLFYLSKYLTKLDDEVPLHHHMETQKDHLKGRVIGSVDAAYFLCGWNKHCNSRDVVFINITALGKEQRRNVTPLIASFPPNSTRIFTKTYIEKYFAHHRQLQHITLVEYFTLYRVSVEEDVDDEFENEVLTSHSGLGELAGSFYTIEAEEWDDRVDMSLPIYCTDATVRRYHKRDSARKLPFWRTHLYSQNDVEAFFYQHLILYMPFSTKGDLDDFFATNHRSWRDSFFATASLPAFRLSPDKLAEIRRVDQSLQLQLFNAVRPIELVQAELDQLLALVNIQLIAIYNSILIDPGVHIVYGAAGTGKSFLLTMLSKALKVSGLTPVVLAPTGIAANTVAGITIDRFFGLNMHQTSIYNPVRLYDFLKTRPRTVFLIDECSMLTSVKIDELSTQLKNATEKSIAFGGFNTVFFFGDLAQLPPIDKRNGGYSFDNSEFSSARQHQLWRYQRQSEDFESDFIKFLRYLRVGDFRRDNQYCLQYIKARITDDSTVPANALHLFTTRKEVARYNAQRVHDFSGDLITLNAVNVGKDPKINAQEMYFLNKKLQNQSAPSALRPSFLLSDDNIRKLQRDKALVHGLNPSALTTVSIHCAKPSTLFESINRFELLNIPNISHNPEKYYAYDFTAAKVNDAVLSTIHRLKREKAQREKKTKNKIDLQRKIAT